MKHIRLTIATMALVFATIFTVQAQAPYHYGIGVTAGNMQALSFKACSGHFAFQLDLGTKIVCTNGRYSKHLSFEGIIPKTKCTLFQNQMYSFQLTLISN